MIDWRQWGHEPLFLSALLLVACATALIRGPFRGSFRVLPHPVYITWGLIIAYLAVAPPWEQVGRFYLFSAQMAEQLALMYGAAALLVAGWSPICREGESGPEPSVAYLRARARGDVQVRGGAGKPNPFPATRRPVTRGGIWSIGCGVLFILGSGMWYLPHLAERALQSEAGLAVEHLSLLLLGMIFWWPVLSRNRTWPALPYGARMLYLLVVEVALAGAFSYLLMAEHAIYPTFEIAPRLVAKLSPEEDQVLAGVLLSGVGSIVLVTALGAAFFAWARDDNGGARRPDAL